MIPHGPYCYDNKGRCPYFTIKFINNIGITWCKYLNLGDLGNITDNEFKNLKQFHNNEDVNKLYPLSVLWDQVKECNINWSYKNEI